MFPSIDAQQRFELANNGILVLLSDGSNQLDVSCMIATFRFTHGIGFYPDSPSLVVFNQPCPAAALDSGQLRIHCFLQVLQSAKCRVDGFPKLSARRLSSSFTFGR